MKKAPVYPCYSCAEGRLRIMENLLGQITSKRDDIRVGLDTKNRYETCKFKRGRTN